MTACGWLFALRAAKRDGAFEASLFCKAPLYVMVNLALGGGQSTEDTPNPSYLFVDYIRVYAPPNS
jgi:hypothetical protein